MNVNKFLFVHKALSASTHQVPLPAQVGSDHLTMNICLIFGSKCSCCTVFISSIARTFQSILGTQTINTDQFCALMFVCTDAEPSSLSAASVVSAVIVVVGGVASLLLLMFCYRR